MVVLKEIKRENLDEVLALSVAEHQASYVSTVSDSLTQAYVYRDTAFPFAIYADDMPIGFIMLGYYESRKQYTLFKIGMLVQYITGGIVWSIRLCPWRI